jgi:hypothetical protein
MVGYPGDPFLTDGTDNAAYGHPVTFGNIFWIGRDNTADMDFPGGVNKIAIRQIETYMGNPLSRLTEEKQVAGLKKTDLGIVDNLAILCLLRGIAGQNNSLSIVKQFDKARTIGRFS